MKKLNRVLPLSMLLVLASTAGPVLSQSGEYPEFREADTNGDGVLSIMEARQALPSISITDANGDGMVSKSEAAAAVPGLMLSPEGSSEDMVGANEYTQIVSVLRQGEYREDS